MTAPADPAPAQPAAGRPTSRVDGPAKVTGRARYSGEHRPDNLAYAATADAAIPAGTVRHIDTADAERAPGVLLVLTHRNADRLPYRDVEPRPAVEPASGRQLRVLQDSSVLFSGQPLAVVVADTQAHAEYAAGLIRIEYSPDPRPVTRFVPGHARPASRAAAERGRGPRTEHGDPDGALAAAAATVDSVYVLPREHHNPIELFAAVAQWDGGSLTLWSKTQWVGNERDTIAAIFGIPASDVRVISPYVGGAFGAGLRTWPHVTLAAMAARRAGRPVRLELTRRQMYTSTGFRPHTVQHVALGADQCGAPAGARPGRGRPDVDLRGIRRGDPGRSAENVRRGQPAHDVPAGADAHQHARTDARARACDRAGGPGDRHGRTGRRPRT